jgi:hypothetical protein
VAPNRAPVAPTAYAERLTVPWWLWLPVLALAGILATELWLGVPGPRAWVPYAVLLPLAAIGVWWLGRIRVAVTDGELWVDDAHLPVRFIADAVPLDVAGRRELLGVSADPMAFVVQRPWISGALQVIVDDPADPTPYWLISSRRPDRLAEALLAARELGEAGRAGQ